MEDKDLAEIYAVWWTQSIQDNLQVGAQQEITWGQLFRKALLVFGVEGAQNKEVKYYYPDLLTTLDNGSERWNLVYDRGNKLELTLVTDVSPFKATKKKIEETLAEIQKQLQEKHQIHSAASLERAMRELYADQDLSLIHI